MIAAAAVMTRAVASGALLPAAAGPRGVETFDEYLVRAVGVLAS